MRAKNKVSPSQIGAAVVLATVIMLVFSGRVAAHEQEEVRFLMNQIDRMEQRLLTLEQMMNGQSGSLPGSAMQAGDEWDSLAEGMGEQQVLQILGRPGKVHEASPKSTWFYPDLLGGSVFFENGRVTGWQKP